MNDVTTLSADLVVISDEKALSVYAPDDGSTDAIDTFIDIVKKAVDGFEGDVTTAAGRKEIASVAHRVTKSKTYLEGVGKNLSAAQKAIPKKIDATVKHRGKINSSARDALVAGGVDIDIATLTITLIAESKIPHVTIAY